MDSGGSKSSGMEVTDRYVDVGGVKTRYREAGEGDPAILLIHGLGASLECWQKNMGPLAEEHRTIALDLVWFGKTDKPAREITGGYFAEFLVGFMDAVGVKRSVLVGNSMGGMIAVKAAADYPERIAGLVLVNSAGFGPELAWWLRLRSEVPIARLMRPTMFSYRYAIRQLVYDPSVVTDDLVSVFVEMSNQPGAQEAHRRVLKTGVDWRGLKRAALDEIIGSAHSIRVPTLIIWGQQDRVVPVAHAQVARKSIPNARIHIFDRCGHAPMIEKADEFNSLVMEFAAAIPAPRTAASGPISAQGVPSIARS